MKKVLILSALSCLSISCANQEFSDYEGPKDGKNAELTVTQVYGGALLESNNGTSAVVLHGKKGIKGDTGEKGQAGMKGEKGDQGTAGAKGDRGEQGQTGAQGLNGQDGTNGQDGQGCTVQKVGNKSYLTCGSTTTTILDGTNGQDGNDGLNGQDGSNGMDGIDGLNGQDGVDGVDGTDGQNAVILTEVNLPSNSCQQIGLNTWAQNINNGQIFDVYYNSNCWDNQGEYCDNVEASYSQSSSSTVCWVENVQYSGVRQDNGDIKIKILTFSENN